jgi:gliding-associated putative ABC transporter substrate-binding component GldG
MKIIKEFFNKEKNKGMLTALNVLIIVVLINILVSFSHFKIDLSPNKIHSISPATEKIIKEVDDIVEIKVFISEELPPQVSPLKEELLSLLQNYKDVSNDKIIIERVDPNKDSQAKQDAAKLGIQPMQFSTVESDKLEVANGYFALTVSHKDKVEVIQALQNLQNLEYYLTSSIKKVSSGEIKKIGMTNADPNPTTGSQPLIAQGIEQSYSFNPINLESETYDLDSVDVLIINNPTDELSQNAQVYIDQFIQSGKGVIIFYDQYSINNQLQAMPNPSNISEIIKHYGFEVQDKMILDSSAVVAGFRSADSSSFYTLYPFWIKTAKEGLNPDYSFTSGINTLVFNWTSPLVLSKDANYLVKTTDQAWIDQSETPNLDPTRKYSQADVKETGSKVIAGIQQNKIESLFADTDLPNTTLEALNSESLISGENDLRLVVVADADFINDNALMNNQENYVFAMNIIDFLALESDLSSIRSKALSVYPLKTIEDSQKQLIRIAGLLSPILISGILLGGVYFYRKKYINSSQT